MFKTFENLKKYESLKSHSPPSLVTTTPTHYNSSETSLLGCLVDAPRLTRILGLRLMGDVAWCRWVWVWGGGGGEVDGGVIFLTF